MKIIAKIKKYKRFCKYALHFKNLLKVQHIPNVVIEGEDEYVAYWKRLSMFVEPYSYRFFSHYCGRTKYIMPEDIGHSCIEALFNPREKTPYWEDKNLFPTYLPTGSCPQTIMCRRKGGEICNAAFLPIPDINFTSNPLQTANYIARIAWGGGNS